MLRSDVENKSMALQTNPAIAFAANFQREKLLLEIDCASIDVAEAEKAERTAMDAYLLALAALSAVKRRSRNDADCPMTDEEYADARAKIEQADKARVLANQIANRARGKLQRLLKRADTQRTLDAYWASQREHATK